MSFYTELPPGFIDDNDLCLTRNLTVAPNWSVRYNELSKYGLDRNYYDEMLAQCNPYILNTLVDVSITKINMPILRSFQNLTSLTVQLKDHSWPDFVSELVNLPKLQILRAKARGCLNVDDFAKISKFCPDLMDFLFPHSCQWDSDAYLAILKQSKIRKISPWRGLGGKSPQSIKSVIKILTEMRDLIDFELYLKKNPSNELKYEYNELGKLPELLTKHQSVKDPCYLVIFYKNLIFYCI